MRRKKNEEKYGKWESTGKGKEKGKMTDSR